jgi:hypothetical protein
LELTSDRLLAGYFVYDCIRGPSRHNAFVESLVASVSTSWLDLWDRSGVWREGTARLGRAYLSVEEDRWLMLDVGFRRWVDVWSVLGLVDGGLVRQTVMEPEIDLRTEHLSSSGTLSQPYV